MYSSCMTGYGCIVYTYVRSYLAAIDLQHNPSTQLLAPVGQLLQTSPAVYGSCPT